MNKNITEEELLLRKRARRRLVGAIVLVLVAVIFLPMIFDDPKPDTETHEIDIHLFPKDAITGIPPLTAPSDHVSKNAASEYIDPMEFAQESPSAFSDIPQSFEQGESLIQGAESAAPKRHIPIPGIKPRYERAQAAPTTTIQNAPIVRQQPAAETTPPPVSPPAATASPPATAVSSERPAPVQQGGAYVVQLGAFSDQTKAQQHQSMLISKGFNAFTETLTINGNVMTRVRIGPFANRALAQGELDKLRRLGQDGVVAPQ